MPKCTSMSTFFFVHFIFIARNASKKLRTESADVWNSTACLVLSKLKKYIISNYTAISNSTIFFNTFRNHALWKYYVATKNLFSLDQHGSISNDRAFHICLSQYICKEISRCDFTSGTFSDIWSSSARIEFSSSVVYFIYQCRILL